VATQKKVGGLRNSGKGKEPLRSSSEKLKEKADKTSGAAKIPTKPKMTPPPISQMVLPPGTKKTQP
jgi:hypothetical protein